MPIPRSPVETKFTFFPGRALLRAFALVLCLKFATARAQVPPVINYQGRLSVGTSNFDGTGLFKLALISGNGSQVYWRNATDADNDGQPDSAVTLTVNRGLFSVLLGDSRLSNMAPLSSDVFTNSAVHLRVWFNDGVHGFQQLAPDQPITPVGYAMMAANVPDGSVSLAKLAAGTLNAANLTGSLSPAQIPNLDAAKITSGSLNAARLPVSVAFKDTDLLSVSNALSAQLMATSAALVARIDALAAHLDALSNRVHTLLSSGLTVVSTDAQDPALTATGYGSFTSVAASPWAAGSTTDAPSARSGQAAVWTGQEMIVWGGNLAADVSSAFGGIYEPASDQWRTVTSVNAPSARSGHTAVWTGQEMIVWGGFSDAFLNTGARF